MNKIILIGNLTRDPELRVTSSSISVCNITLAVNREHVNDDGSRVADFFNVKIWREQAVNCSKYLHKGSKIAVTGSLQNRSYEDQNGNVRYATEIIAQNVEFLSYNGESQSSDEAEAKSEEPTEVSESVPF